MKCDRCNRPAIVHEVIITDGTHKEIHLCELHAKEAGMPNPGKQPLHQLMAKLGAQIGAPAQTTAARCSGCGATLAQIRQTSLFGCPECYTTFAPATQQLIEQAQGGATCHQGRCPEGHSINEARRYETRRIMEELDRAVNAEQYERAAELRDKLDQLGQGPID